jgi:hypothetical protein
VVLVVLAPLELTETIQSLEAYLQQPAVVVVEQMTAMVLVVMVVLVVVVVLFSQTAGQEVQELLDKEVMEVVLLTQVAVEVPL